MRWQREQEERKENKQMKMTVTESDKKLLSCLFAFLAAILFIMFGFRPLLTKSASVRRELSAARVEAKNYDKKLQDSDAMSREETEMTERSQTVLARFYPMLQSQDAERMATVLMLNHNLRIQSLQISMPEVSEKLKWYQYAVHEEETQGNGMEEEETENIQLYAARVTCVADGSKKDLWALVDDISANYPAISISSMEWSVTEQLAENGKTSADALAENAEDNGGDPQENDSQTVNVPQTVKTDRLTISLEIFMCNQ